jgi:hypothetical protein
LSSSLLSLHLTHLIFSVLLVNQTPSFVTMFHSRPLLLLALLGLAMLAAARPLSNSQRLARGLPPAKPNRLFDATRVRGGYSPQI